MPGDAVSVPDDSEPAARLLGLLDEIMAAIIDSFGPLTVGEALDLVAQMPMKDFLQALLGSQS